MEKDVIHCKDCSSMDEIPDGEIDLIISGPPYWDYIDYEAFAESGGKADFTWQNVTLYDEYLGKLEQWYSECYRVLRAGRYCVVNLGTLSRNGRCWALPFHAVPVLERIGFEFRFEIIWHKISAGRKHARVTIQNPFPGYFAPNNRVEYLLVFQKEPKVPFSPDWFEPRRAENRFEVDELFAREIANNVWHIMPPTAGPKTHPCPFPPEIPLRLIRLFSLKGETILDPFMGVGTTAWAAKKLGRHFVGYELNKHFRDEAIRSLDKDRSLRRPLVVRYQPSRE